MGEEWRGRLREDELGFEQGRIRWWLEMALGLPAAGVGERSAWRSCFGSPQHTIR